MSAEPAQAAGRPLRVGVIGTGVIAQVMHLHYLAELSREFEVAAVCDIVEANAVACAREHGIGYACTDYRDLVAQPLDAVLVLSSGSHAPIAIAAARAGRHVFVEKPMCFSATEGKAMVAAADEAGVVLMVGYPKRYDPAYARFAQEVSETSDARLLRVTTLESPFLPYVGHYRLRPPAPPPGDVAGRLRAESDAAVDAAIGPADELDRRVYREVLLDTLVHEINTVRGLLGEPDWLDYVDLSEHAVTALLRFGGLRVAIHWVDLPGIARYQMEFALYAPDRRVTLAFPSPYLRSEPATLVVEGGDVGSPGGSGGSPPRAGTPGGSGGSPPRAGTARSWRREEVAGYESGFRRELEVFHECVMTGATPPTSGRDGLADIALCQSIIECHRRGRPVADPAGTG